MKNYHECFVCNKPITAKAELQFHHRHYRSNGGSDDPENMAPVHKKCHIRLHSEQGDYRKWGRRSAETRAYSLTLRGVRNHPAYAFDRAYYLALYAH